ncbi:hypothetical protein C4A71_02759 [Escherichia coli]|nr:hypothetical protein C4A71_02759 [Escherichia coli]RDO73789.1 hypothetical protein C4A69_02720 [Escherichia coli]
MVAKKEFCLTFLRVVKAENTLVLVHDGEEAWRGMIHSSECLS